MQAADDVCHEDVAEMPRQLNNGSAPTSQSLRIGFPASGAEPPRRDSPTTLAKLRGLPWSMAGNALNSIFSQFTVFGSVFVLFLNALGLSKSQIGGLLAILPFTSVLAIFLAPAVARFGYKRTFLSAYGSRKVVTAFLLLTPWVVASYGADAALGFVAVTVTVFAVLRALMEIALIPWVQEYVPNSVRGKYAATDNIFVTLAGLLAISIAGAVIGRTTGLTGYMLLIGAGVLAGFAALWSFSFIPGGAPLLTHPQGRSLIQELKSACQDRDFRRYLAGAGLLTLGVASVAAFTPLYLQEQVGIEPGQVVWVQIGTLLGALVSSYLWGWAADRYGSNPVMRSGAALLAVLPLGWWLMPRGTDLSLYFALGIAFVQGIANLGWAIGAGRLLHVSLVPPEKKMGYLALYSTAIGTVGGLSQLMGGWILDAAQAVDGQWAVFRLDPYVPLFLLGTVLLAACQFVLQSIRAESSVGVREFVSIFFRGNPFMALGSLVRYQLARDERATILGTESLARAGSRLTVEELVESLADPRFHVRYEAAVTISRMRRDPRLTRAMLQLLEGTELPLSIQAAWALGRMGDKSAIGPLRKATENPYRSIQVHSIRALGALGDTESIPMLLARLRAEGDRGLQMASAAALGTLGAQEAVPDLLRLLQQVENQGARMELAMSLARLVGREHLFIRLLRQMRADPGTTAAQTLSGLKPRPPRKQLPRRQQCKSASDEPSPAGPGPLLDAAIDAFASQRMAEGARLLGQFIQHSTPCCAQQPAPAILAACGTRLATDEDTRQEYLILALHILTAACQL